MLDLARPDTECQGADPAVRGGVTVPTNDGGAGQRKALLGADDMDDTLFGRGSIDIVDPEGRRIAFKGGELRCTLCIFDRQARTVCSNPLRGRQIVIRDRKRKVGAPYGSTSQPQGFECLRAGHFVDEVTIDIDQASPVIEPIDDMLIPNLFVKSARFAGHCGEP